MDKNIYEQLSVDIAKIMPPDIMGEVFNEENYFEQFKKKLIGHINSLLVNDYPALLRLLYRVDVDETKAGNCMKGADLSNTSSCLSELIIERLIKKIEYRRQNK